MGDRVEALVERDGWQADGQAARVHYDGGTDRYSIEYYELSDCVVYWKVAPDRDLAVPVGRDTVPDPLRERIRQDLAAADIDPDVESRTL